jgi:protein gp37
VRGCSRVSAGCTACYAETQAARIVRMAKGKPSAYDGLVKVTAAGEPRWTGEVRLVPEMLSWPLRKRAPLRIFVNSMSDLFHEGLPNEQIAAVFGVMAAAPQHTFQVLTKRATRMREWFAWLDEHGRSVMWREATAHAFNGIDVTNRRLYEWWRDAEHAYTWPLPNVWLGVSVENQAAADERIPELLRTPAAVRFLSCEPLIGAVRLNDVALHGRFIECPDEERGEEVDPCAGCPAIPNDGLRGGDYCGAVRGPHVDWVIAGCESGPGARPCSVEWLRSLRDQCSEAGVAFFLKQAQVTDTGWIITAGDGSKRKAGGVIELPYLDSEQHAAFPEVRREA